MLKKTRYGPKKKRYKQRRFIKIGNKPNGKYNWVLYKRYLWIKEHGSIPKGMCIVSLDGNWMNDSMDNLACMKRVDYMRYLETRFPKRKEQRIRRMLASRLKNKKAKDPCKPITELWECPSCGYDNKTKFNQCPRCNSHLSEIIKIALKER